MPSFDMTAADSVLKELYPKEKVQEMMYKDSPLLALLGKGTKFYGKNMVIPIRIGTPQGRSATFATAQTNAVGSVYKDFTITRVKDYAVASIDRETMLATESDEGAFIDAATSEIDGCLESLRRSIAWGLYGDGSGTIGQALAAVTSGVTIALKSAEDVVRFEVGQKVVVYSAKSGGSIRTYNGSVSVITVAGVNRDTGVLTFAETFTASSTVAANDFLFIEGDRGLKVSGLGAWLPDVAPSATAFFGVDRTVDSTRLAGRIIDGIGKPIEEVLIDAARKIARDGGKPDMVVMSYNQYASLEKSLGSKVQYIDVSVGEIGFQAIKINGPKGVIKVLADQDCPDNRGYMLQSDTWKLHSLGELVSLVDQDSNQMLRSSNSDAFEVRAAAYFQLACNAPGYSGVIKFST